MGVTLCVVCWQKNSWIFRTMMSYRQEEAGGDEVRK